MQEGLLITESTVLNTANPRQLHVHYQIYMLRLVKCRLQLFFRLGSNHWCQHPSADSQEA